MEQTFENLAQAFAGESQANRKYLAFARKAEEEGFGQIAKLFRAAAEAETIHALNHLREMGGVRSTRENLEDAITGESYEFQKMYPEMMEVAKAEGKNKALRSFTIANDVEKIHAALYTRALEKMGEAVPEADYYVCQVCGNTVESEIPDSCHVCGAKKNAFRKVA